MAVLHAIGIWNELILPTIYLTNKNYYPITRGMIVFQGVYGSNWPTLAAAVLIMTLPMVIIFLVLQRYIVSGLTAGSCQGLGPAVETEMRAKMRRMPAQSCWSLVVACLLAACTAETAMPTATPIPEPPGWKLVWHDEFDGKAIDSANWTYDIGGGGWGNGEAEYYTSRPENARVENGMLVIEARQEKYEDSYYTSARLKTQGLQTFQYGRIEARIKVPSGDGLWPAFWMLGARLRRDQLARLR